MKQRTTKEQVYDACEKLFNSGVPITANNLRKQCGNSGSFSTYQKYLNEWKNETQKDLTQNSLTLPAVMVDMSNQFVQKIYNHAYLNAEQHIVDERIEILEHENQSLRDENERLKEEAMKVEILQNQFNQLLETMKKEAIEKERMNTEIQELKKNLEMVMTLPK